MCAAVARAELSGWKTAKFSPILPQQRAQPQAARCGAPPPDRNAFVLPALPALVSGRRQNSDTVSSQFADSETDTHPQQQELAEEVGRSAKGRSFEHAARSTMPSRIQLPLCEGQNTRYRRRRRPSYSMRSSSGTKFEEGDDILPASKLYTMTASGWHPGKRSHSKRSKTKEISTMNPGFDSGDCLLVDLVVQNFNERGTLKECGPVLTASEYIEEQAQLRAKADIPVKLPDLAISRGENFDMSWKEEEELELARHRREIGYRAAQNHRQMARHRRVHLLQQEEAVSRRDESRRKKKTRKATKPEEPQPDDEQPEAGNFAFGMLAETPLVSLAEDSASGSLNVAADEAAENCEGDDADEQSGEERAPRKSIFSFINHKTHRETRLDVLKRLNKSRRQANRLGRLLEFRRLEFEARPEEEKEALKKAFSHAQRHSSGSTLDCKTLRKALDELGLTAKTDMEKKEVRCICDEMCILGDVDFLTFVIDAVPRAREKLKEMRRGPLLQQFQMYDTDDSGHLAEVECLQIFERLYTFNLDTKGISLMRSSFDEAMKEGDGDGDGEVDFENFEMLMSAAGEHYQRILREREKEIIHSEHLTDKEVQEFADELVSLHDSFVRANLDGNCGIDRQELRMLLIEYGLYPRNEEGQQQVDQYLIECDADADGNLNFQEFLTVIRNVRNLFQQKSEAELRRVFDQYDKDKSGALNMCEVSLLLGQLGLTPRCREDQCEMKRLLDCIDDDGSGIINFSEFQMLVQRVTERMNAAQRRRERNAAAKLEYGDAQVSELRDAFYALDSQGAGILSIEKLRKALDLLRLQMSAEDLQALMERLDTGFVGGLDFEQFLHFMSEVTANNK